ncbi:hypothetical protein BJ170DRAFT_100817 [Xylariales sp. AK1849]|nr:hypothetical protein BJ170DRAFT_100817 [Xylariales sp. AK1849]
MKEYTAEEWLPAKAGLGESPLYRASDDTLFFVDIKNQLLHMVPVALGWNGKRTFEFDEPVTRLELVAGTADLLAVQTRLGFSLLDLSNGELKPIASIHYENTNLDGQVRMNDGAIDARGRWWAGTMALDEESDIGKLWCLQRDGNAIAVEDLPAVPNGPVFSPDDRIMYLAETPRGKVYQYDYDVETGRPTNKRLFVQLDDGGMPDGMAVDDEGYVWVSANSQGKVVRFSAAGTPDGVVTVPGGKMCSCPGFGDIDRRTLFITSIAADGSTGSVYRVKVDVPGINRHTYQLSN